jgi:hypothetical protein
MSRVLKKTAKKHLTEDAIEDYLGGYTPKRVKKHLRRCNLCCGRMLHMRAVNIQIAQRERSKALRSVRKHQRRDLTTDDRLHAVRPRLLSGAEWDKVKEAWFTPSACAALLIGLCFAVNRQSPEDRETAFLLLLLSATFIAIVAVAWYLEELERTAEY